MKVPEILRGQLSTLWLKQRLKTRACQPDLVLISLVGSTMYVCDFISCPNIEGYHLNADFWLENNLKPGPQLHVLPWHPSAGAYTGDCLPKWVIHSPTCHSPVVLPWLASFVHLIIVNSVDIWVFISLLQHRFPGYRLKGWTDSGCKLSVLFSELNLLFLSHHSTPFLNILHFFFYLYISDLFLFNHLTSFYLHISILAFWD